MWYGLVLGDGAVSSVVQLMVSGFRIIICHCLCVALQMHYAWVVIPLLVTSHCKLAAANPTCTMIAG